MVLRRDVYHLVKVKLDLSELVELRRDRVFEDRGAKDGGEKIGSSRELIDRRERHLEFGHECARKER